MRSAGGRDECQDFACGGARERLLAHSKSSWMSVTLWYSRYMPWIHEPVTEGSRTLLNILYDAIYLCWLPFHSS